MIIRSKAPLRISFGGGGTDVSPYAEERGGAVLSVTINKYAYATLATRLNNAITVRSRDYDTTVKYSVGDRPLYDGNLDLAKAAIKVIKVTQGFDLYLHADAPLGSGLGASSTLVVALVGAFQRWLNLPYTDYQIAELAYQLEREEVGIKGGRQDQYSATFGGFNFIEFVDNIAIVNPLRIKEETVNELHYRLLLCYTGKTRRSAGIIDDQIQGYVERRADVVQALDQTKRLAYEMKNALLLGQIDRFGELLHEAWLQKQRFSDKISDPDIDALYQVALQSGAIGGKLLGAGGGGYLLLLCQFDKKQEVAAKLNEYGGQIVDFSFDHSGLQTWEVVNPRGGRGAD